ncbi:heat shock 70 kDa protein 12A-like [Dreissena polymorpha]|uniref:Heat shock 70 kDa protein 12A n=1 Tax=Dreissena polymorpha TaxID=45954 RepID=A0A9D4DY88_DREPO|nr:heat shock 70 kDa protein 12A-like [Dreissena polymorpha]XP_052229785.1 heat shock 70 kDa protein 12A-like [Dreissena polymorpha]XP_052229786.1 heat shock 70 kDa protein 12A-like [Dreissena polymorpha]KAH3769786.1 hypothetical protein DPMN_171062 [Dreissena polymorpha]
MGSSNSRPGTQTHTKPDLKRNTEQEIPSALGVASIDFGTTYSGWAFSFTNDPKCFITKEWYSGSMHSSKAPTCALFQPDGKTFEAFGYDAENKYVKLASKDDHKDWYFVSKFKMSLFESEATLGRHSMLEDVTGKPINSMMVFSSVIKYLHDDLLKSLNSQNTGGIEKGEINWVLTVPAIWDENAKQFMRIAAREAGIDMGRLSLALEPEVAAIYCLDANLARSHHSSGSEISTLPLGTRYLLCDAGGGTVDITVHEVLQGKKLKEIEQASGGAWGCSTVDEAFEKLINTLAGGAVMQEFKLKFMEHYLQLLRRFELLKREFNPETSNEAVLWITTAIFDVVQDLTGNNLEYQIKNSPYKSQVQLWFDRLKFDASFISALFAGPVKSIVDQLSTLMSKHSAKPINHIVMVGGFSESPFLQEAVKSAFPGVNVIVPHDAVLAVLKGAVLFGHNKRKIVSRIARFTYGIASCIEYDKDIHPAGKVVQQGPRKGRVNRCFSKLVDIGQSLPCEEAAGIGAYRPYTGRSSYLAHVYATTNKVPVFVTDAGCFMIGGFRVNCKDKNGEISNSILKMYFGGTEIEVKATLDTTGEEIAATFDLPE